MSSAKLTFSATDNASSVINHIEKQLGIFNKTGIAMGISFALVTKAIQLAQEGIQRLGQEMMNGIKRAIDFEYNLVLVTNTIKDMDMSIGEMSDELHDMSLKFGADINTLAVNLKMFTRESYSSSEALRMLGQAEFYAKAKGEDLTSTIEAINRAMGIFNLHSEDSGYILAKYNELTALTGLNIQDIADILGRASVKIQEYGYNLDDVVNIMYTLAKSEIGSRSFSPAFIDFLEGKGFKNIALMPADTVKTLDTQMDNIVETHKSAIDRIGAAWDGFWELFAQGGLDAADAIHGSIESVRAAVLEPLPPEVQAALMAVTGMGVKKAPLTIGDITPPPPKEVKPKSLIQSYKDYFTAIRPIVEEQKKLRNIRDYNEDLRYMSMGLTDASYAAKIHNSATKELVDSIRIQKDAIDELNTANQKYSISSNKINLEIMKIQYAAMGTRRGLTRSQERDIKRLEQADTALRISMMENQIAIDQKTLDLSPEQKKFEQLTAWYNEELYIVQDTYAAEYQALVDKITAEQVALNENLKFRREYLRQLNSPSPNTINFSDFLKKLSREGWNIPFLGSRQFGGDIPQTGPYLLHKGETVIPANKTSNSIININISNPVVRNKSDTIELAHTIKRAISQGVLDSTGQTKSRWR